MKSFHSNCVKPIVPSLQSVSTGRKTRPNISQCQFAMPLFSLHDIRKKAALKYFVKLKEKKTCASISF